MKKKKRHEIIEEEFDILAAYDHDVVQFSPYHFRINGRLDIWPTARKAYDIVSHRKHKYDDLVSFVMDQFPESQGQIAHLQSI